MEFVQGRLEKGSVGHGSGFLTRAQWQQRLRAAAGPSLSALPERFGAGATAAMAVRQTLPLRWAGAAWCGPGLSPV